MHNPQKGNKLTVVFSGTSFSGKLTASNFVFCEYLNRKIGQKRFQVQKIGKEYFTVDLFNNNQIIPIAYPNSYADAIYNSYSIKVYSFDDVLKSFCIDVFGFEVEQLYGSEEDQNSPTHLNWDDLSETIRDKYSRPKRGSHSQKPATGIMTPKEVTNIFEHEFLRKLDQNALSRATYRNIERDGYDVAILIDAKFPSDITIGTEQNAKVIRLLKNDEQSEILEINHLKDFPLGEYSLVVDNSNLSAEQTYNVIKSKVIGWFQDRKVI